MIDSHQHFWRYDPAEYGWIDESMDVLRRDFLPEHAWCEMQQAGVAGSIAVQARQTLEETHWLLALADRHSFIRGVVGWIDLQGDVDAQLEPFADAAKLSGIRHIVQAEPDDFLDREVFRAGVARLSRHGLTYDVLVYARQLPAAIRFARAFSQPLVLDHLGKPDIRGGEIERWRGDLRSLAELPHVVCKLSGLVTEAEWTSWTPSMLRPYLDAALEAFGPSRLMVGSDWPVCTVAATYKDVVALVRDAISEYSPDEQAQILGKTAEELYFHSA